MKKIFRASTIIIAALLLFTTGCSKKSALANPRLLQSGITIDNSSGRILIAAHRGYSKKYPENTMLAFRKAVALDIDEIEFDIHLSKDGVPVVIHDDTLDRTTNGSGGIGLRTLAQLKTLDAGGFKGLRFKGEKIPTFEEILNLAKEYPGLLMNVEIKQYDHDTVDKTMALLERYKMDDRYVITCFDAATLKYAHDTYHVKCQGFPEEKMSTFDESPASGTYSYLYAVGISTKLLTADSVREFEKLGIQPWTYTPDTAKKVKAALASGVTLLTCNDPKPAAKELKKLGLR